jgi:hypothetical protein
MLTATRNQTALMLGVSVDSVDNLLHQGRLQRTPGSRFVFITLSSICTHVCLPLDVVVREARLVSENLRQPERGAAPGDAAQDASVPFPAAPRKDQPTEERGRSTAPM